MARTQSSAGGRAGGVRPRLVTRVQAGLAALLLLVPLTALSDLYLYPDRLAPLYAIKIAHLVVLAGSFLFLAQRHGRRTVIRITLLNALVSILLIGASGVVVGDDTTTSMVAATFAIVSAALMPWGLIPHLWVIAFGMFGSLGTILLIHDTIPASYTYRLITLGIIWAWSVYIVGAFQRRRLAVARAERERRRAERAVAREGRTSAALAQVGQELIARLSHPGLLDRLCETTVHVLGCDFSHTWLWDTRHDAIVPVAGFGDPEEIWASLRECRIPREAAIQGNLADLLARGDVGQIVLDDGADPEHVPAALRPVIYGLTVLACVPLHRGSELIGAHIAGYRGQHRSFTPEQERIMKGIGQLASMALEYTLTLDRLEKANRIKSEFVANVSHELKTPINVIQGYTDLILDGEYGTLDPEMEETVRRVEESARSLQELVGATLDLSRLESGGVDSVSEAIPVSELLVRLEEELAPVPGNGEVHFRWDLDPAVRRIHGDEPKLRRVLKALLSNALKFTERGEVVARLRPQGGGVEITVTDTGPGIPPEVREHIFEPFRQGDGSSTRVHGGTGLGLHVAWRLVQAMGGELDCESEVGRGSTFRLWIPARYET